MRDVNKKMGELLPTRSIAPRVDHKGRSLPGPVVRLRAGQRSDARAWSRLRLQGREHLEPWEPEGTESWERANAPRRWQRTQRLNRKALQLRLAIPAVIEVDGDFAGQLTLGGIVRGAQQSAWVGYWVGAPFVRRGVGRAAVALAVELAFAQLGLERIEATVQPDNAASIAVLEANGFRTEGWMRAYLAVQGERRDHLLYALLREDWAARLAERGET